MQWRNCPGQVFSWPATHGGEALWDGAAWQAEGAPGERENLEKLAALAAPDQAAKRAELRAQMRSRTLEGLRVKLKACTSYLHEAAAIEDMIQAGQVRACTQ